MLKQLTKLKEIRLIKELTKKLALLLPDDSTSTKATIIPDLNKVNKLIDIDYPRFSSILPYRYYWEEKRLFINEHSIGFGLELTVFCGADEKIINSISDLLKYRIADDLDLQFVLWGSNQVGEIIDHAYSQQLANNNIYSELTKEAINYYKKAAVLGFKNKLNLPLGLREYRLFAFLSKNTPYSESAVIDIENARDDFTAELESADIGFTELSLTSFLSLLRSWINPNSKNIYPSNEGYEEYTTLNEQVVDRSFELINGEDRLSIEIYPERSDEIKDKNNKEEQTSNNKNQRHSKPSGAIKTDRVRTKLTNLSIRTLPDEFALWQTPNNFFNVFRAMRWTPSY